MNARHMKEDPNWITDQDTLEVERAMWTSLGLHIDLDPYSSTIANTIVRADRFFTEAQDGFNQLHLAEAMHVNHPGGTTKKAWKKLIEEVRQGRTKRACWVGFSVEQLCILADPGTFPHPQDFSTVMLRTRIDFLKEKTLLPGGRPGHANYITVLGVPKDIVDHFWSPLGRVFHGRFAGTLEMNVALGLL